MKSKEIRGSKIETSFGQRLLKKIAPLFQNNPEYIASSLLKKPPILSSRKTKGWLFFLDLCILQNGRGKQRGKWYRMITPICSKKTHLPSSGQRCCGTRTPLWRPGTILTEDPDEGFAPIPLLVLSEILGDFEFSLFRRLGPPHPPQTGPRLSSQLWEGFLSSLQARLGLGGVG